MTPRKVENKLSALLEVQDLGVRFGGVTAIDSVSMDVSEHEVVGVIGPNGAGKTSLFNCITGFYRLSQGHVRLDGIEVTGKRPYQISRLGIRRTFQNVRLFNDLSGDVQYSFRCSLGGKSSTDIEDSVYSLCDDLRLSHDVLSRSAGGLPYGVQRRVEIARALVAAPRLLLVDEPGAGLNGDEKRLIVQLLRAAARDRPIGIVLIEHDMGMIARACDRVIVLDRGAVIATGQPAEVRRDPAVIAAYIGNEAHAEHS